MFERFFDRLSGIFDAPARRGARREPDVGETMDEVRRALLDVDVRRDVVRSFVGKTTIHLA